MSSPPPSSAPPPAALERLRGLLPAVVVAVRAVKWLALSGAAAALLVWAMVFAGWLGAPGARGGASLLALGLLMVPPAGAGLAAWMFTQVLKLPARIRELPAEAAGVARSLRGAREAQDVRGGRRIVGIAALMWKLRGILGAGRGAWLKASGVAPLAKLASLPLIGFMVASMIACVALIGVAAAGVLITLLSALF